MRPGTSAIVGRRSSSSPRSITPEVRLEGGERVVGDLGRAAVRAARSVDLPAFGSPTRPMSAMSRSSRRSQRSSPGSPFWACLGAWWVDGREVHVAEAAAAAARDHRPLADRDEVGEQLAGLVVEDGRARAGPSRTRSSPALPWRRDRSPRPPGVALKWCLTWKSRSVVWPGVHRAGRPSRRGRRRRRRDRRAGRAPPAGRSLPRRRRRRRGPRSSRGRGTSRSFSHGVRVAPGIRAAAPSADD